MILLNPPFRDLKDATIEPIKVDQEKLDELESILSNPKLPNVRKSFVTKAYYCHLFLLSSNSLDNTSLKSFSMVGNITQWAINLLMFKSPNCFAIWVILIIILSFLS